VDLRKVNRRVFEALIRGGAFDTYIHLASSIFYIGHGFSNTAMYDIL
jgi:DNA polymerase III alpha subunit